MGKFWDRLDAVEPVLNIELRVTRGVDTGGDGGFTCQVTSNGKHEAIFLGGNSKDPFESCKKAIQVYSESLCTRSASHQLHQQSSRALEESL